MTRRAVLALDLLRSAPFRIGQAGPFVRVTGYGDLVVALFLSLAASPW